MTTVCFVTFEIHPTTGGGCGVLLHHAATHLLERGHEVVFCLDVPPNQARRFRDHDRLALPNPDNCRVHDWRELARRCPLGPSDVPMGNQLRGARYLHAYRELLRREPGLDYIEFIEYCGVGYYPFLARLFRSEPTDARTPVCAVRLHNPIELIDRFSPTDQFSDDRYLMYALERASIHLADTVLTPTTSYHKAYFERDYALPADAVTVSQSPKLPFPEVKARPSADGPFSIVFVGRMWHFKGVDQLIHAACVLMERRPELDFTVDLIGPDSKESPYHQSYTEYLKTQIPPKLRRRFVFAGNISHEQISERLERALFGVFPNHFESFCYALHEAYDAGVPVVVKELPGFADFFEHQRNCLKYDGSTEDLVSKMTLMLDDHELRESLRRPYPVATEPLGTIYERPVRLTPIVDESVDPPSSGFRSLLLILCDRDAAEAGPTISALRAQSNRAFDVLVLAPTEPESGETLWLLGRPWRATDVHGDPAPAHSLTTRDALAVLVAGDRPRPVWHGACAGALIRRPGLAFAGTWLRRPGRIDAVDLDLCPEIAPFRPRVTRPRVLLRTEAGRGLIDLFDMNLGHLGEIGYAWRAIERYGAGAVVPDLLFDAVNERAEPVDQHLAQYLLARYGAPFADRLKLYTGVLQQRVRRLGRRLADAQHGEPAHIEPAAAAHMDVEQKIEAASSLGGRTLVRITLDKLVHRIQNGRTHAK